MLQRVTVRIPTINDRLEDFRNLFEIWDQVNQYSLDVLFDFSNCYFLRPNAVAFLGGLAHFINYRNGTARFDWSTVRADVLKNLNRNNFTRAFGGPSSQYQQAGNTVTYRQDLRKDEGDICSYLENEWIGCGLVHVSQVLQAHIVGNVWEIYENAFDHANSEIGVFSCGQYFPRKRLLQLSVIDFGVGIPANVRHKMHINGRPVERGAAACMRWAFQPGTSTKDSITRRGMGLELLKSFIKTNHGKLECYSHEGYTLIRDNEVYENLTAFFKGTLVNITLRCDEGYYILGDEAPQEIRF